MEKQGGDKYEHQRMIIAHQHPTHQSLNSPLGSKRGTLFSAVGLKHVDSADFFRRYWAALALSSSSVLNAMFWYCRSNIRLLCRRGVMGVLCSSSATDWSTSTRPLFSTYSFSSNCYWILHTVPTLLVQTVIGSKRTMDKSLKFTIGFADLFF